MGIFFTSGIFFSGIVNSRMPEYIVYIISLLLIIIPTFFLQGNMFELNLAILYTCIALQGLGVGINLNTGVLIFSLRNDP